MEGSNTRFTNTRHMSNTITKPLGSLDKRLGRQESYISSSQPTLLPVKDLYSSQERPIPSSNYRSQPTQQLYKLSTHNLGQSQQSRENNNTSSLACNNRHKRSLCTHSNPSKSPTFSRVFPQRSTVFLPRSSIWSQSSPLYFHKSSLLATPNPQGKGSANTCIFGRHNSVASSERNIAQTHRPYNSNIREIGLSNKQTKVTVGADKTDNLVGNRLVGSDWSVESNNRQNRSSNTFGQAVLGKQAEHQTRVGTTVGRNEFHHSSTQIPQTISSPTLSNVNTCSRHSARQDESNTPSLVISPTRMAESCNMGRSTLFSQSLSQTNVMDGCFRNGLGGTLGRQQNTVGPLVKFTETKAHKSTRALHYKSSSSELRHLPSTSNSIHRQRNH